jgi:23S rRNA (adenine-N6)-dimethyltransferase
VAGRTDRDRRRRSLGQNFLVDRGVARRIAATVVPGELVVDLGAGTGALTIPLAEAGARVVAVEADPVWAAKLSDRLAALGLGDVVEVVGGDILTVPLPSDPYRVVASPPYGITTRLSRRLLDRPEHGPYRADLLLQWEVARKRSQMPPTTLLSTMWSPWWEMTLVERVPRSAFSPVPRVDAGWLAVRRRLPPLLPSRLAPGYARFLRAEWDQ